MDVLLDDKLTHTVTDLKAGAYTFTTENGHIMIVLY